jgi:hypothetical protein
MTDEKMLAICIVLIIAASPFFFWLILYFANPQSEVALKAQISRIKQLRWITYITGVALGLFWLLDHLPNHYWIFGSAVISAPAGLVFPDRWLKNRMARSENPKGSSPATITPIV